MKRLFLLLLFFASPALAVDLAADLTWVNNATNATDIVIERQDGPTAPFVAIRTVAPTQNTYQDVISGASEGLTYCYRANPRNAVGTTVSPAGCAVSVAMPVATSGMNVNLHEVGAQPVTAKPKAPTKAPAKTPPKK